MPTNIQPQTETDRIVREMDTAMIQAREVTKGVMEYKHHSREEFLALANAIFIRNAVKSAKAAT